jgi:hypothetical protein
VKRRARVRWKRISGGCAEGEGTDILQTSAQAAPAQLVPQLAKERMVNFGGLPRAIVGITVLQPRRQGQKHLPQLAHERGIRPQGVRGEQRIVEKESVVGGHVLR